MAIKKLNTKTAEMLEEWTDFNKLEELIRLASELKDQPEGEVPKTFVKKYVNPIIKKCGFKYSKDIDYIIRQLKRIGPKQYALKVKGYLKRNLLLLRLDKRLNHGKLRKSLTAYIASQVIHDNALTVKAEEIYNKTYKSRAFF